MLCIVVVGSNEMATVMTFATTLLLLVSNRRNQQNRPYLLFLFAVCVCACLVAVLAPETMPGWKRTQMQKSPYGPLYMRLF